MSISGPAYVRLIAAHKLEKSQTIEDIQRLQDDLDAEQSKAYEALLSLSAEIANKYFKEANHDVSFPSRIQSSVTLMENEIKRLDVGMDMAEYEDKELDFNLADLTSKLNTWTSIKLELQCPAQETALFKKAVDLIERNGRDDFPVVESLAQMQEADDKFLDDSNSLAESVQSIVQQHEADMKRRTELLDAALRANNERIGQQLAVQAEAVKAQLKKERQEHRQGLDKLYDAMLSTFVTNAEHAFLRTNPAYHRLARGGADTEPGEKESKQTDPARPPMWKSEIDTLYLTALKEDRMRRALEAQLDRTLIAELSATKIEVQDHGMGDEYLNTLMSKLTALYLEANDIDLRTAATNARQPAHTGMGSASASPVRSSHPPHRAWE